MASDFSFSIGKRGPSFSTFGVSSQSNVPFMILRIVKLTFDPSEVDKFKEKFAANRSKIRNFEGCEHLELLQDRKTPNIFFTYSCWENEEALNSYRHSDFFRGIWAGIKKLFSEKPEAWSVDKVRETEPSRKLV